MDERLRAAHIDESGVRLPSGYRLYVNRLRRSRDLTKDMRIDHQKKVTDPLLWIPDFVAGCWIAAQHHGEPEPWEILNEAHMIDVRDSK